MAIPTRTLAATIEISTGAMTITSQPPEFVGEVSATAVEISLLMGGEAYTPSGVSALMYLYWPGTPKMTEAVALTIDGSVLRGNLTDAMTVRPGCPLLVIQLVDGGTGDVIVAAASPIQITQVRGNMVVSTRPADPEEIVYVGRAPYINPSTLTWMQWDATSRSYVDSGVYAVGQGVASVNGILPTTPGGNVQVRGTDIAVSSTDTRTIAEALEDAGPVQTVNGVSPDSSGNVAVTAADIGQTAITTDNDTVDEALSSLSEEIVNLQDGLAIIVDGDTASVAVPVNGYAYIKNNTHGLSEGLYKNTSTSVFPATGGTANSTVFSSASGALNSVESEIATLNSNITGLFHVIDQAYSNVSLNGSREANIGPTPTVTGYKYLMAYVRNASTNAGALRYENANQEGSGNGWICGDTASVTITHVIVRYIYVLNSLSLF